MRLGWTRMRASEQEMARAVRLALDRHQLRREQGIPTLGVLIGTAAEAAAAWEAWAQAMGWRADIRPASDSAATEETSAGTALLYLCPEQGEFTKFFDPAPGTPGPGENAVTTREESFGNTQPWLEITETVDRLWRVLNAADQDRRRQPLALAVSPEAAARLLGDAPLDRARTFFAEGVVTLTAGSAPEPAGANPSVGATPSLTQSAPSLARQPLRPAITAGFEAAQASCRRVAAGLAGAEETDRARSAAERFLADLLDELPETCGLFELNTRLDFCFGVKPAEVDLLAAGLGLAVEIDGYYHFRDPEGYRRDRRKDALLQRRGYLVLRFLAEDVVSRLEEILEEIRTAVAFRRATRREVVLNHRKTL